MYRIGTFENNKDATYWMNTLEKENFEFVSSNSYAKVGYVALCIIMHKDE